MSNIIETWNALSAWWLSCAVHITWQGSLLALLALGLLLIARRWPAPLRHAVLLLVLVKFLVPPFLATPTGAFSQVEVASTQLATPAVQPTEEAPGAGQQPVRMMGATPGASGLDDPDDPTGAVPAAVSPRAADSLPSASSALPQPTWQAWLAAIWALGAIIAAARTFVGMRSLAQLRRRGTSAPNAVQAQFSELLRELSVRRKPRLLVTEEAAGPVAFGVLRPTVLVPRTILGMPAPELRLVLAHELVHHRRCDLLISWLQVAVSIVWWFNPVVRLVDRAVRGVREECCDDLLLARGIADRDVYCQSLLRTACLMGVTHHTKLSAAYNEHPMGQRFRRIMDNTRTQRSRLGLSGSAAVLTMACIALPGIAKQAAQDPQSQVEVAGRVLDANGKPVAGAHVYVGSDEQGSAPRTATAADGKFIFSCAKPANGKAITVAATASGHGLNWAKVESGKPVEVQLTSDVAVRGQLLDQEGQPLAGATLSVLLMHASEDESLAPMMDKIKSGDAIKSHPMWNTLRRRFKGPGFPTGLKTDADGRFEATGLGAERAVVFVVRAAGATTAAFTVLTRKTETFTYPKGGAKTIMGARTFYGAEFVYIAPAGRTVVGRVEDEDGQPVAGAQVRVEIPAGTDASGSPTTGVDNFQGEAAATISPTYMRIETGADGRFVMQGLPQTKFSTMTVDGHALGYSYDSARIPNEAGDEPIELDFQLARAATVHGKVLDQDGKPVVGARVRYQDKMRSAGFRAGDPDGIVAMQYGAKTATDGSYRLVIPVGDARLSVYASAAYQPTKVPRGTMIGFMGGSMHAFVEFEAKVGDNDAIDFKLLAADTARITVIDPDGKPLSGCRMVGKDPQDTWSKAQPGHEIVLRGFNEKRPRLVAVYHEKRNLIGMLDAEALQGKQPWVLKTQPASTIVGRLVDVDGAPRQGVPIYARSDIPNNFSMFVTGTMETLAGTKKTDADGRFTLKGLMPGAKFAVRTLDDDMYARRRLAEGVETKAGETEDVGSCVGELIR